MRTKLHYMFILLAVSAGVEPAGAQSPVISSLSQNGVLVCTNLQPGTLASVEWASSLAGPWQTNWAGLDAVFVDANGKIQVSVPMFYRVRGVTNSSSTTPPGMAFIRAGSFMMGDTLDGDSDAIPITVNVSGFYMDTNLVSYSQWQGVYSWATNHGYGFVHAGAGKAANHPVQTVDWYDCVKWCNARSVQAGLTPVYYTNAGFTQLFTNGDDPTTVYQNLAANGYRLPTEAEWEKAARGGLSGQRFPWGNTISGSQADYYGYPNPPHSGGLTYDLGPYTGYNTNFAIGGYPYTSPVGYFAANGYGLYDMAGNVYEWCWDWYGTPYGQPTTTNPTGAGPGSGGRVMRGGYWDYDAYYARCASRSIYDPPSNAYYAIGFRCVRGF